MYVDGAAALEIGTKVYENRKYLARISQKIRTWLKRGYLRLLVFGAGGTGKSTLGRVLSDGFDPNVHTDYRESRSTDQFSWSDDVFGTMIIPPGQESRRDYHWPELYDFLSEGKSAGVIHVVSYGYHSIQTLPYRQVNPFQDGMSKDDFLNGYLQSRRQKEIDVLKTLQPHLMQAPGKIWMLTLITKQDLWWDQREDVRNWYRNEPYRSPIREIEKSRGEQNFQHEWASASLISQNFVDGEGTRLASTVAGYDEITKAANLKQLKTVISELADA